MDSLMLAQAADIPDTLMQNAVPLAGIVIGGSVAAVWVVAATADGIVKARGRERSRRELAAYVAEGSMNADEAERLLKAAPEG